ncbi:MAG: hypothetical protein IJM30_09685 [Thermoguttaceae bacterium]|nr:hypothetical protein [Thermoguttaceae bacterium]
MKIQFQSFRAAGAVLLVALFIVGGTVARGADDSAKKDDIKTLVANYLSETLETPDSLPPIRRAVLTAENENRLEGTALEVAYSSARLLANQASVKGATKSPLIYATTRIFDDATKEAFISTLESLDKLGSESLIRVRDKDEAEFAELVAPIWRDALREALVDAFSEYPNAPREEPPRWCKALIAATGSVLERYDMDRAIDFLFDFCASAETDAFKAALDEVLAASGEKFDPNDSEFLRRANVALENAMTRAIEDVLPEGVALDQSEDAFAPARKVRVPALQAAGIVNAFHKEMLDAVLNPGKENEYVKIAVSEAVKSVADMKVMDSSDPSQLFVPRYFGLEAKLEPSKSSFGALLALILGSATTKNRAERRALIVAFDKLFQESLTQALDATDPGELVDLFSEGEAEKIAEYSATRLQKALVENAKNVAEYYRDAKENESETSPWVEEFLDGVQMYPDLNGDLSKEMQALGAHGGFFVAGAVTDAYLVAYWNSVAALNSIEENDSEEIETEELAEAAINSVFSELVKVRGQNPFK